MAALSEDGRYGLNCGRNTDRITVLHVKLTETAIRALENYRNCKVSLNDLKTSHCRLINFSRAGGRDSSATHYNIICWPKWGKKDAVRKCCQTNLLYDNEKKPSDYEAVFLLKKLN